MQFDPDKHHRRSIRLKDYDYSNPGAYFRTVWAYNRECLFGDIANDKMQLNEYGKIIEAEWLRSSEIGTEIELDVYQVMPNHFHAIVWIMPTVGANSRWPLQYNVRLSKRSRPKMRSKSLSSLISGFKSSTTSKINEFRHTLGISVWQRNYYEHIIRDDNELNNFREYIVNNPLRWELDKENPRNWVDS